MHNQPLSLMNAGNSLVLALEQLRAIGMQDQPGVFPQFPGCYDAYYEKFRLWQMHSCEARASMANQDGQPLCAAGAAYWLRNALVEMLEPAQAVLDEIGRQALESGLHDLGEYLCVDASCSAAFAEARRLCSEAACI